MRLPAENIQALAAIAFFAAALLVARAAVNVHSGRWPGGEGAVLLLRVLLGFLAAGAVGLAFGSFAGVDMISMHL